MRWTVRLAVASVFLRAILRLRYRARDSISLSTAECCLWGVGCLAYLSHVVLAFHFVHRWSHDDAWRHTANETARLIGIQRGDGLWANYAFTVIWILDLVRLIVARISGRPTSSKTDMAIFFAFAFMVFNATVVFGPAFYRWLAIPAFLWMLLAWRRGVACDDHPMLGKSVR